MIPEDVNVGEIVAHLKSDAVYVPPALIDGNTESATQLHRDLTTVAEDLGQSSQTASLGEVKIVVLNEYFPATGLRDTAQAVKDETGADTVLVQTPNTSSTVSDEASRYAIEKGQRSMGGYAHGQDDGSTSFNTDSTVEFLHSIAEPEATLPVNASGLTAVAVTALVSVWAARKFYTAP